MPSIWAAVVCLILERITGGDSRWRSTARSGNARVVIKNAGYFVLHIIFDRGDHADIRDTDR
jgi:hypothetical protein